jgi:D-3-phosphoglycerate dehydrogenase
MASSSTPIALVTDATPDFFRSGLQARGFALQTIDRKAPPERLRAAVADAHLLLVQTGMKVDEALLSVAPRLECVMRPGSGLDEIDLAAARRRGIRVLSSPEGNQEAVGDHALGLLLGLTKRIVRAHDEVARGAWVREPNRGVELSELRVGIVGYGHTGPAFARRLAGFGCALRVYDPYRKLAFPAASPARQVSLAELQATCEVVSFHVPLTQETRGYFDRAFLAAMAHPFYLLNTARGEVVELEALQEGLDAGRVLGAGLDVLPEEPPGKLRPRLEALLATGRVVLTPHIAGWSGRSQKALYQILLDKWDQQTRFA